MPLPVLFTGNAKRSFPVIANSRLWLSRKHNVYSDVAGTTPATIGGTVGSWRAVGGGWGTDLLTQATGTLRPTLESDGIKSDGTDDYLGWAGLTLGAAWTIYTVQSRLSGTVSVALGSTAAGNLLGAWSGDGAYFPYNGSVARPSPFTDSNNTKVIRRGRRVGDNCLYKVGSAAELSNACLTGDTFLFDRALNRPTNQSASTSRLFQIVIITKTVTHGDADDLAIRAKLLALEPGTTDFN